MPSPLRQRWFLLFTVAIGVLPAGGCVRRVMQIQSEPEGALVSVDRTVVGHTPVAVPFTYYGTREIRLEKDGYEPLAAKQRILAPWYDIPPLSFFSNHFALREIRDTRSFNFQMRPKTITDESQLLDRANQMRTDVARGTVAFPLQTAEGETTTTQR